MVWKKRNAGNVLKLDSHDCSNDNCNCNIKFTVSRMFVVVVKAPPSEINTIIEGSDIHGNRP